MDQYGSGRNGATRTHKTRHDFSRDERLTYAQREVGRALDRLTRDGHDCWCKTESIADAARVSVRTVRNAIRRFAELGLIEIVWGTYNRTGRAIRLLWRTVKEFVPGVSYKQTVAAKLAVPSGKICRSEPSPPQTPPVEEPEGNTKENNNDGENSPELLLSDSFSPVLGEGKENPEESKPALTQPTPEQLQPVILEVMAKRATKALKCDQSRAYAYCARLAARFDFAWVAAAIDRAGRKATSNTDRYIHAILEAWQKGGGPVGHEATEVVGVTWDLRRTAKAQLNGRATS